jgi:PadR family transcriptional regulator, regulatory protein PadR
MYIRNMNTNLLRGSLETIVINLLNENGEMYGYEITKKVKELSSDKINITEGALYPILHKLEGNGILSVDTRFENNRYRKYYSITKKGKSALASYLEEMQDYLTTMQLLLKPSNA